MADSTRLDRFDAVLYRTVWYHHKMQAKPLVFVIGREEKRREEERRGEKRREEKRREEKRREEKSLVGRQAACASQWYQYMYSCLISTLKHTIRHERRRVCALCLSVCQFVGESSTDGRKGGRKEGARAGSGSVIAALTTVSLFFCLEAGRQAGPQRSRVETLCVYCSSRAVPWSLRSARRGCAVQCYAIQEKISDGEDVQRAGLGVA
jgi:hypothetical protein